MDFKFSKDAGDSQPQEAPDDKKKQSALLVLLLVLVGGFTYIYFFTGLIKPQETEETVVQAVPAVKAEIVKIPLPPREGETAKTEAKQTEAGTATNAVVPVAAAVKPTPAKAPVKQSTVPAAKPVVVPSKATQTAKATPQKEEPKKNVAKPAEKKIEPAAAANLKGELKKPRQTVKSPAADKQNLPVKANMKKPAAVAKAKVETGAKPKKSASGSWSLNVGNYVLEEALSADLGRIRKAGFQPVIKASARKKSPMNRLLLAEFTDRASAQPTLDKLKKQTSDAFVIEQGGKFAVIAGSYLQAAAAKSEQERLKAAGFNVAIKRIDITIPSKSLSVGPFTSKTAADSALAKLRNSGIKASLSNN